MRCRHRHGRFIHRGISIRSGSLSRDGVSEVLIVTSHSPCALGDFQIVERTMDRPSANLGASWVGWALHANVRLWRGNALFSHAGKNGVVLRRNSSTVEAPS
jgi:hypothetical protein